jgi:hypothetical protein
VKFIKRKKYRYDNRKHITERRSRVDRPQYKFFKKFRYGFRKALGRVERTHRRDTGRQDRKDRVLVDQKGRERKESAFVFPKFMLCRKRRAKARREYFGYKSTNRKKLKGGKGGNRFSVDC